MTTIGAIVGRLRGILVPAGDGAGPAAGVGATDSGAGEAAGDPGVSRRERGLGRPEEILHGALAQKVLHGWLQNRNQVLVPLTLRLGQLRADDVELLMRFAAASFLAASPPGEEARATLVRWLRSIGAIDEAILVFDRSLAAPTALSTLLDRAQARHLEAYAYAVAVMAADLRVVHGRLYADFTAARLQLPADAVRSINRRFRR